jgi:hypothetical protein
MSCHRRRSWPPPRDLQALRRRGARRRGEGPGHRRGGASWMKPVRAGLRRRPPPEVEAAYSPRRWRGGREGEDGATDIRGPPLPATPSPFVARLDDTVHRRGIHRRRRSSMSPLPLARGAGEGQGPEPPAPQAAPAIGSSMAARGRRLKEKSRLKEPPPSLQCSGCAAVGSTLFKVVEAALDSPATAARKMRSLRGEERELHGGRGGRRRRSGKPHAARRKGGGGALAGWAGRAWRDPLAQGAWGGSAVGSSPAWPPRLGAALTRHGFGGGGSKVGRRGREREWLGVGAAGWGRGIKNGSAPGWLG